MTDDIVDLDTNQRTALLAEYATLREEILKRIDMRQQLISMTLTIAAVFLGVGLTTASVALLYPALAAFLALAWNQNDYRVRLASRYIRQFHEPPLSLGWEHYCQSARHDWRVVVVSHSGIFTLTQLMAVMIGVFNFASSPLEWALLALDLVSILLVLWLFWRAR